MSQRTEYTKLGVRRSTYTRVENIAAAERMTRIEVAEFFCDLYSVASPQLRERARKVVDGNHAQNRKRRAG